MKAPFSNSEKLHAFISDFVKIVSLHRFLIRTLDRAVVQNEYCPFMGQWAFRIKAFYHRKMADEIRCVISAHDGISALQMLDACEGVDKAVDELYIDDIQVTILQRARLLFRQYQKILKNNYLPLNLQDKLIKHLVQLEDLYVNLSDVQRQKTTTQKIELPQVLERRKISISSI